MREIPAIGCNTRGSANRRRPGKPVFAAAATVALCLTLVHGLALVFFSTGDPEFHTSPPTNAYANAGWQWETDNSFCGTAVGPKHMITANHLAQSWLLDSGGGLFFDGLYYTILAATNAPDSDIRLLWIAGRFGSWAPIYTNRNEIGSDVFMLGRGGARGARVTTADGAGGVRTNGWLWNPGDGRLRWGANQVYSTTPDTNLTWPHNMIFRFRESADPDIATISGGDSGGGVFIRDNDGRWKLAGTIFVAEAEFKYAPADTNSFLAAVYDRNNLYELDDSNNWILDPAAPSSPWTIFASTRLSDFGDWIGREIAAPPPVDPGVRLLEAEAPAGPYTESLAYALNPFKRTIDVVQRGPGDRFFRIDGADKILGFTATNGVATLRY
jgi:hypothetical protein